MLFPIEIILNENPVPIRTCFPDVGKMLTSLVKSKP